MLLLLPSDVLLLLLLLRCEEAGLLLLLPACWSATAGGDTGTEACALGRTTSPSSAALLKHLLLWASRTRLAEGGRLPRRTPWLCCCCHKTAGLRQWHCMQSQG